MTLDPQDLAVIVLGGLVAVALLLPVRWDPAIRWKERQEEARLPIEIKTNLGNVYALSFGKPPFHHRGNKVLVCESRGCMAEQLWPTYLGVIRRSVKLGRNKDIPGIEIRVTDPLDSEYEIGAVRTELTDRLRRLDTGRLVIVN